MEQDDRIKEKEAMIAAQARLLFDAKKHKQVNKHFLVAPVFRDMMKFHLYFMVIICINIIIITIAAIIITDITTIIMASIFSIILIYVRK
jgi:hypothetical protein